MPVMEQRRSTVIIRQQQQQNEGRPWPRTTMNIAIAIGLGIVAIIALISIFLVIRRFREKNNNKVQMNSTASQRLRGGESQSRVSIGSLPVILPGDGTRGMRSLDSFGSETWRAAFAEKPVLPRDGTQDINITSPAGIVITPRNGNNNNSTAPRINSTIVISRGIPDAPTTALYSTSNAITSAQPHNLTRRSVSTRAQIPQDVSDSEVSNQSVAFARFSALSDYVDPSPKGGNGEKYTGPPVSNPFSQSGHGHVENEDYFDAAFTASSIVRTYVEEGEEAVKQRSSTYGGKSRESDATIGTTRSSTVLSANTFNGGGIPSAATTIAASRDSTIPEVPPLPPVLPPVETTARISLGRMSTGSRILHSNSRPSIEADGISAVRKERPGSQLTTTMTSPTSPERKPTHSTNNSTSSVVNLYPQEVKRRGQLRTTPRRKERPVSLMVPAIPRRLDVIITASPGPGPS